MADHGILHSQAAALRQDPLIIRGAVFSGIKDLPAFHGLPGLFDVPAVCIRPGKPDRIQSVQGPEHVHGRRSRQIDIFHRLVYHSRLLRHILRGLLPFRHQEHTAPVGHSQHLEAVLVKIHGKLLCILQLQPPCIFQGRKLQGTEPVPGSGSSGRFTAR